MNCMMSCLVMRPPSPVPAICERLTPCSRAILRTSGEERASSPSSSWAEAAGAGIGGGVGAFFSSFAAGAGADGAAFAGADAAGLAAAASPSIAIVPTIVFTPSPAVAQADQIKGQSQAAEVIGSALVYPNQGSDRELASIGTCLAQGVQQ